MTKNNNIVIIAGKKFSKQDYDYLLSRFKEAFSHSSLTVEQAFQELESYNIMIEKNMDENAFDYYNLLPHHEKQKIKEILHQIIVFYGKQQSVFTEKLTDDVRQIEKIYHQYFDYFEKYIYYFIKFDSEGKFDRVATFHNLQMLFYNLPQRRGAYKKAYNMKKDNLNAFDYAMTLDEITIPEVIKINSIVNNSDEDKVLGFKTTNNDILTASFTPADKEIVPIEMQKLFADYKNNFGLEILDPNEANITTEERLRRSYNIFKREAIFHIRFERIHPFNDGNGRTGRIILNYNLLKHQQAPVLITDVMSEDYKNCINSFDIDGLTKLLITSSSQQLTNWISLSKAGLFVRRNNNYPNNEKLAELKEYDNNDKFYVKRKNNNIFKKLNGFTIF